MMKHKLLLEREGCKICEIGDRVYMWQDNILIAHYDGKKLYLTSADIWEDPSGRYNILLETARIPEDTPTDKVEQTILQQYEENVDDETRKAIDSLRL